ncbi:MAG: hypothetical protein GHCLOJNM_04634 [bacterium]|nr:hypothetical protein [bacterium]
MDNRLEHITLAALLHDIGKVMQRAEVPVSDQTESLMASAGPTRDGHSSHYHVKWTSQFFEDHLGDCGLLIPVSLDESASYLAFRHHNPATPLEYIVSEADRLSSGMDRGESHNERDSHKRRRLVPLQVLLSREQSPISPYPQVPLCELTSRDASCFPRRDFTVDQSLVPDYRRIWKRFLEDWDSFRTSGLEATLARLDALYERHFWCVPASSVDEIPDTSLYGHSRTVAAIAGALYLYHRELDNLETGTIRDRTIPKFRLVAGDLAGIQSYIFAISHAGGGKVAKRLRARSFSLGCLTQVLALQIVREVGLPYLNIILSAGGKFHLLLPNTPTTKTILEHREALCQRWLREEFQGLVSLNLASVEMSGQDFASKRVGEKFTELAGELLRKKHQPLGGILKNKEGWVENDFLLPSAIHKNESPTGYYDVEGPLDEEALGSQLSRAKCLAIYDSKRGEHKVFDWSFSIAEHANRLPPAAAYLISFERGAEVDYHEPMVPVRYEYRASHVPLYRRGKHPKLDEIAARMSAADTEDSLQEGQVLPFNAIAKTATGRDSIAYLKADVDNLGFLFRRGLDWNDVGWTLSKMATFSRSLEFFFSGRVHNILREPAFEMIYTVYSGGDDVLLVGPWDAIHEFARRLREEWSAFTAANPHLTLSVGIALARPMTPVWAAADSAETALEHAKTQPKDQLCSFGHLIRWAQVPHVFAEIEKVSTWLNSKTVSTAFVRSLLYYADLAAQYRTQGRVEGLRYLPLLSYNLSRNLRGETASEVRRWAEALKDVEGDAIRNLGFVATYSLNLNRG